VVPRRQLCPLEGVWAERTRPRGVGGTEAAPAAADEHQRERYVEPLVRGEKSTAFAQTEPGAGSDSPTVETTAERDGNEWVIDGTKQ
jgi:acyl-CoA dehydrogenase